jgi:hypothetical protein
MISHPMRRIHWPSAALIVAMMTLAGGSAFAQAPPIPPPAAAIGPVPAASEDIRDIRGPKPIDSPWLIPLIGLGGTLAVGAAFAAWAWYRRRQRGAIKGLAEIALERLARARELMAPEKCREFSIEVSGVVRAYIEQRFLVMAAHRTTDEFLHDLLEPAESLLAANRALLSRFLQSCDLAKFGGWNLTMDDMETMLQSAMRFVAAAAPPPGKAAEKIAIHISPSRATYDSLPST